MTTIETPRLLLSALTADDAPFILRLVNEPDFIANIRDSGVRTAADAVRYIEEGPRASYSTHGFGLLKATERESGEPVGMCGLLKRDSLPEPDLGFAFITPVRGRGYATEAAAAVLGWAGRAGIGRVLAITAPHNAGSVRVLEKVGMRFERMIEAPDQPPLRLFAWQTAAAESGQPSRP